jgi:histidine triad (HIT) family protein
MDNADCLFCRIAAGQIPATIVHEHDAVVAFRDIHPQAPVHVLVIPRAHIAGISGATPADARLLGECLLVAREVAVAEGLADRGWRLVINSGADAGETVPHLHVHLIGGRPLGWPPG